MKYLTRQIAVKQRNNNILLKSKTTKEVNGS